ncbi:hypothetical protein BCR35DRAFT_309912 [Leucosporidium creatinivorum]|uniref:Bromo domain-containing protein n=1 Tax=Leucosporidium creatinivorum TaxID=106004 RepID=A0A1Y2DAS2_9BASI|nr:hypothetical protein BCR35DRAFT_309912 [Leucosporidium creatinivorum]
MKYLFEAIDARQGRLVLPKGGAATRPRPKHDAIELKKLVVEASEGLDDKSSANDFVDTLERIVNEIKNTTEHSGAFLQKVRKTDVPDYYDVIKRPMDLATLLKRVKQQTYRTKKAFADDLDLIWSNCLLYNSHPSHPLRRSAEILRQKSNQLLEFITDPSLPTRSIYAATVVQEARQKGSQRGTPALGDEDADAEGDSEEERAAGIKSVQASRLRKEGSIASAVPNGINGDGREASDSPMPSRADTPVGERMVTRKLGRGPLGRGTRSPSPVAPALPFEERPAIIRTAQGMHDFLALDGELSRLDEQLGLIPTPSTSSAPLLPPQSAPSAATPSATPAPATDSPRHPPPTPSQTLLLNLVRSLNPVSYPSPTPPPLNTTNGATPASVDATPVASPAPPAPSLRKPDEPPDALWWDTVGSGGAHPSTSGLPPQALKALASGVPECPWAGVAAPEARKRRKVAKQAGKGKEVEQGVEAMESAQAEVKRKRKARAGVEVPGLGGRMRQNFETLRKIRRLHGKLASGSRSLDPAEPRSTLGSEDDYDSETEDTKPARPSSYLATGIPREAFQSHLAPQAARDSLGLVSNRILGHAGFDGSSTMALGVLAHVAAEYIMNLGRTLRFYSDRYAGKLTTEQILLHVLSENGVPSPSALEEYVSEDIDHYSAKLADLHGKLERARRDQLDGVEPGPGVAGEEEAFARDGEALSAGELSHLVGDDFFGLAEVGLDKELGSKALHIPMRLFRGEPKGPAAEQPESGSLTISDLPFPPPPSFPLLTPSAIGSQIGLLQPYFTLRQSTDHGLVEDFAQPIRPKNNPRGKVPPVSGRIKRPAAPTQEAAPVKKKKKKAVVVVASGEEEG